MNFPKSRILKFHKKYKKTKRGCWKWRGTHHYSGYGCFKLNGKMWRAHRLMWVMLKGNIPDSLYVLHHCDRKNCVNPKHLFLGTAQDNINDCISKGRFRVAFGKRHGTKTHPERIARGLRHGSKTHPEKWYKGEKLPWSKLTNKIVRKIRKEWKPGIFGTVKLAKKYGVSQHAIYCLVTRKTWKYI